MIDHNDIIKFLKDSKQELSAGTPLTYDNLEAFIKSSLIGLTVGDLVEYYEKLVEKKVEEQKVKDSKLIQGIINMSGDDSPNSWFNALRCALATIKDQEV